MTVDKQPEALRLAGELSHPCDGLRWNDGDQLLPQAAAELRRLHALNQELLEALKDYDEAFTEFDPSSKECRHRMRQAVIKARAAIAKATGKTK